MQRSWANFSLLGAFVLFLIGLVLPEPLTGYVKTMALASLAGGIADWYAVTALFRHPMGMKWLPHTAIISANRERIIAAISTLVEQELLSTEYLDGVLARIQVFPALIRFLRSPGTIDGGAEWGRQFLASVGDLVDEEQVGAWLHQVVGDASRKFSASNTLVAVLRWLIQSGRDRELFTFLGAQVEYLLDSVELNRDLEQRLKDMLERYSSTTSRKLLLGLLETLGTVDYGELTRAIRESLRQWLHSPEAVEQFELVLVRMMVMIRDDSGVRNRIEAVKEAILDAVPWDLLVGHTVAEVQQWASSEGAADNLGQWAMGFAELLENRPEATARLEERVKDLVVATVHRYHPVIGRLVSQHLSEMHEQEWIDKLEGYVGKDLQWIRVNGAIVGGIVGLVLDALLHILPFR